MALKFVRTVHPGEFLREEYLLSLGLNAGMLAKKLNLPRDRIEPIAKEEIRVTPDTVLRLARYFNMTPEFWMNFQQAPELEKIEPLEAAAELLPLQRSLFQSIVRLTNVALQIMRWSVMRNSQKISVMMRLRNTFSPSSSSAHF